MNDRSQSSAHNNTQHRARKRFGQNFLVDAQVIHKIVAAVGPGNGDNLVEIGPGQGAITQSLLHGAGSLHAVELDRDLAAILEQKFAGQENFHLHQGDALAFDFSALAQDQPLRIVGNLPYNISTPLIFHLLENVNSVKDMHFMLQKEVVERMAAIPSSKPYGRLSVVTQYYCHVDYLFTVPPEAFLPQPKVFSAIVRLTPRKRAVVANDEAFFKTLVKTVFQQRRKTLRNTLKQLRLEDSVQTSLNLSLRPETLTVEDFVTLANELSGGHSHEH